MKDPGMTPEPFYASGLRFACTRCSSCCRHTPGFVFLSEKDVGTLTSKLGLERHEFIKRYCRRVRYGPETRLSLKEKPNVDCILWENDGCSVYEARPLQCRSFPFWSSCVASTEEWAYHARQCPGMGKGPLHSLEEITRWLTLRLKEGFIGA